MFTFEFGYERPNKRDLRGRDSGTRLLVKPEPQREQGKIIFYLVMRSPKHFVISSNICRFIEASVFAKTTD